MRFKEKMKNFFIVFLTTSFLFSSQIPATAATTTLKVGKVVTVSFPSVVSLKKSGCQNIPVKYTILGKLDDYSLVNLSILDDADAYITSTTFYQPPGQDDGKVYKKSSRFNLKVCRNDWQEYYEYEGEFKDRAGVKKGTYQVQLTLWRPLTQKYATIKFK
jgi:hypothetical protein